jgi:hypothetical protein
VAPGAAEQTTRVLVANAPQQEDRLYRIAVKSNVPRIVLWYAIEYLGFIANSRFDLCAPLRSNVKCSTFGDVPSQHHRKTREDRRVAAPFVVNVSVIWSDESDVVNSESLRTGDRRMSRLVVGGTQHVGHSHPLDPAS